MFLPDIVRTVVERIKDRGGRPYFVGGSVRDWIHESIHGMRTLSKDLDIEVFGLGLDDLRSALSEFGEVRGVGQSFGVLKLRLGDIELDVSLPRRESKAGKGHREFAVIPDGTMALVDAARRRDYTMNALMWDSFALKLHDFFDGVEALHYKELKHVDDKTFVDDPLRVLRGMQMCGRFGLRAAERTLCLCRAMVDTYAELTIERVWEEWEKWALKSQFPKLGLDFLVKSMWVHHYPEFAAIIGCEQDAKWHPEGDVYQHSVFAVGEAMYIARRDTLSRHDSLVLIFAALCHDFGKSVTTIRDAEGRVSFPDHAFAGVPIAHTFLKRIGALRMAAPVVAEVLPLVREHMCHIPWNGAIPTDRQLRRLATALAPSSIEALTRLTEADVSGRPPLQRGFPLECALARAREIRVNTLPPPRIIEGRHVLATFENLKPGPEIGIRVNAAREAQLDGDFTDLDGGISWLKLNFA